MPVLCGISILGIVVAVWLPQIGAARGPALRAACRSNLKNIARAMHQYHEVHGSFPPAYTVDKDGNWLHGWRVLILPYLGEAERELYGRIDLEQPWHSPANRAVGSEMPRIYRCPGCKNNDEGTATSYVMIVGQGTISDGPTARTIEEITDGASRTLLIVEVRDSGINWMEPRDLEADGMSFRLNDDGKPSIGSPHPDGANISMCDGSLRFLDEPIDPDQIKAMSTIAGGEDVEFP